MIEHRAEKRVESLKAGAKGKEGLRNRHEASLSQLLKVQKGQVSGQGNQERFLQHCSGPSLSGHCRKTESASSSWRPGTGVLPPHADQSWRGHEQFSSRAMDDGEFLARQV